MPRKRIEGICSVEGCGKPRDSLGLCEEHYYRQWKFGRLHKINTGKKRSHPFYILWHERKQTDSLVPEWRDDFWTFVAAVGEKPSPRHDLVRLRDEPYGPGNFSWKERLQRQPGETKKDWYARKWADQQRQYPGRERKRDLYRKYGMTVEQYDQMNTSQDGLCAICSLPETSIDNRTSRPRRLAVDHCHTGGHVRELLCWRCNAVLGRTNDSPELLRKMIAYLEKHA